MYPCSSDSTFFVALFLDFGACSFMTSKNRCLADSFSNAGEEMMREERGFALADDVRRDA